MKFQAEEPSTEAHPCARMPRISLPSIGETSMCTRSGFAGCFAGRHQHFRVHNHMVSAEVRSPSFEHSKDLADAITHAVTTKSISTNRHARRAGIEDEPVQTREPHDLVPREGHSEMKHGKQFAACRALQTWV